MKLEDYFKKYPHCRRPESKEDKTFGNYSFITEIFYPTWGERGLDKLENEFHFKDAEGNRRRIDFVLHGLCLLRHHLPSLWLMGERKAKAF